VRSFLLSWNPLISSYGGTVGESVPKYRIKNEKTKITRAILRFYYGKAERT
jgi:hypothetical protein